MEYASVGKRRHPRLTFKEPLYDVVTATHDVQILDLSLGGARVEHTNILRPGGVCHLRLPLRGQRVTLLCHVVWSRAVGRVEGETRGTGLLFQSGLQFVNVPSEIQTLLTEYLGAAGIASGEVADIQ